MKKTKQILLKFKRNGYKITQAREIILDVLFSARKHLTAEQLYLQVHKKYPEIGIATIYRSLNLLNKIGIVKKYDFGDGQSRYEFVDKDAKKHHHHLICSECGNVIDYDEFFKEETKLFDYMAKILSKKHRFKITSHEANFYGICRCCQKRKRL